MADDETPLSLQIRAVLIEHVGGWIDNGRRDRVRCVCGYRPQQLGELHAAHVARAVAAAVTS